MFLDMQKFLRLLSLSLLCMLPLTNANAATVSFANSNSLLPETDLNLTFSPTDTLFTLDIIGTDFIELAGGVINFGFNQEVLQVNSVVINTDIFALFPDGGSLSSPGLWSGIGFDVNTPASDPLATGSFRIATVEFEAITTGVSLLDILATSEFFSGTSLITPTLNDTNINITVIPLPATAWLLLSGIIGLMPSLRKMKK